MKNQWTGHSWVLNQNWHFLITPIMGPPLCSGAWAEQTRCATTILEEPTQKVCENEEVPQSVNYLLPAQHQTGETPLGQVNRKLCAFLRMFSGAFLLDQGWKVWCRGKRMCGSQCQHSGGIGTDHTDKFWKIWPIMISSIQLCFVLEIACSKHGGYEMDTLAHALIFGMIIPSWTQMPRNLLVFPMLGTLPLLLFPSGIRDSAPQTNSEPWWNPLGRSWHQPSSLVWKC